MKATTLLTKDHTAVRKLFRADEKAEKSGSNAQKKDIFEALEEHGVVKSLLAQRARNTTI